MLGPDETQQKNQNQNSSYIQEINFLEHIRKHVEELCQRTLGHTNLVRASHVKVRHGTCRRPLEPRVNQNENERGFGVTSPAHCYKQLIEAVDLRYSPRGCP